jgi:hypothetical protein
MASKIIGHAWVTGRSSIGVIVTHDPDNSREPYKARIGSVEGQAEDSDLRALQEWGTRIPVRCALPLIDAMGRWYKPADNVDIYRYANHEHKF